MPGQWAFFRQHPEQPLLQNIESRKRTRSTLLITGRRARDVEDTGYAILHGVGWLRRAAAERPSDARVVSQGPGRDATDNEADDAQIQPTHERPVLPGCSDAVRTRCGCPSNYNLPVDPKEEEPETFHLDDTWVDTPLWQVMEDHQASIEQDPGAP